MFVINEWVDEYLLMSMARDMGWILGSEAPLNCSLDSITHIVSRKEEKWLWFLKKIFFKWDLCCAVLGGTQFKMCLYFFSSHSDDPIVTSLVKQKEFDELVHWHSHRPLSDDYDRTKGQFDGEFCDFWWNTLTSISLSAFYVTMKKFSISWITIMYKVRRYMSVKRVRKEPHFADRHVYRGTQLS